MPKIKIDNQGKLIPVKSGGNISDFETAVFFGDTHIPFINKELFKNFLKFLKDFKPNRIFILGDWVDFYDLSSFDRDPSRRFKLQKEFDLGVKYLEQIRKACPNAAGVFMGGNHEDRLRRWLWRNPDVASLKALDVAGLLHLEELGFDYYPYHEVHNYNGFLIKHGDVARKHSAYTARAELESDGMSGISGHSHRLGAHFKRDHGGQSVWYEAGCVCDLEPHYDVRPNWQNGFAVAYFEKKGDRFFVELVPAIKSRFIFNGIYYRS